MSIKLKLIILFLGVSSIPTIFIVLLFGGINKTVLVVIFIMLLVVLGIAVILAKSIADPIQKLVKTADDIAGGKFDVKVAVGAKDEIGRLAESFSKMAVKLAESHRGLEEKVEERTSELSQKVRELNDAKTAAVNVLVDLSAEKNQLDAEKAKDEAILKSIADGLIVSDKDGRIVLVNKSFEEILGWKAEDVYGKFSSAVIPMKDKNGKTVLERERLLSKTLKRTVATTAVYMRKDGSLLPVALSVSPIILGKESVGAVEVFRDITKEKEIDRAKTEFVSLASHQLKTPPTVIKLLTERILSGKTGALTAKQKEYVDDVHASNQRMIDLVNALLNVSRIELGAFAIQLVNRNICEIIKGAVHDLGPALDKKHLWLKESYPKNDFFLMIDESLFRIVIGNLVANAINYTSESGEISVEFREAKKGQILGEKFLEENCFVVIISDTGCGVPQRQKSKLFVKFFRADNAKGEHPDGTGLGLYIVKSILEHSGGLIWFTSQENKGSVFYVAIPVTGMKEVGNEKESISQ